MSVDMNLKAVGGTPQTPRDLGAIFDTPLSELASGGGIYGEVGLVSGKPVILAVANWDVPTVPGVSFSGSMYMTWAYGVNKEFDCFLKTVFRVSEASMVNLVGSFSINGSPVDEFRLAVEAFDSDMVSLGVIEGANTMASQAAWPDTLSLPIGTKYFKLGLHIKTDADGYYPGGWCVYLSEIYWVPLAASGVEYMKWTYETLQSFLSNNNFPNGLRPWNSGFDYGTETDWSMDDVVGTTVHTVQSGEKAGKYSKYALQMTFPEAYFHFAANFVPEAQFNWYGGGLQAMGIAAVVKANPNVHIHLRSGYETEGGLTSESPSAEIVLPNDDEWFEISANLPPPDSASTDLTRRRLKEMFLVVNFAYNAGHGSPPAEHWLAYLDHARWFPVKQAARYVPTQIVVVRRFRYPGTYGYTFAVDSGQQVLLPAISRRRNVLIQNVGTGTARVGGSEVGEDVGYKLIPDKEVAIADQLDDLYVWSESGLTEVNVLEQVLDKDWAPE